MILVDPAILILLVLTSIVVTASIAPSATIVRLLLALLSVALGRICGLSGSHWSASTAIFVFATMPSNRIWPFFDYFAIASLSSGWLAFVLFVVQIFCMNQDMKFASAASRLFCYN